MIKIDFFEAFRAESRTLHLGGFGAHLCHDYLLIAMQRALQFIKERGWRLDSNLSDVSGVKMLAYKPDNPNQRPAHNPTVNVTHRIQNYGDPCFFCGEARESWKADDNCPAFLEVMGLGQSAPGVEGGQANSAGMSETLSPGLRRLEGE
jgi:hypothetical protein